MTQQNYPNDIFEYEIPNEDDAYFVEDELGNKDGEIGCFERHVKGICFKLMSSIGFHGKGFKKNGQGINKPVCINPRNEGLGYEGNKSNVKFVKS